MCWLRLMRFRDGEMRPQSCLVRLILAQHAKSVHLMVLGLNVDVIPALWEVALLRLLLLVLRKRGWIEIERRVVYLALR